jgi:hypothetical protein
VVLPFIIPTRERTMGWNGRLLVGRWRTLWSATESRYLLTSRDGLLSCSWRARREAAISGEAERRAEPERRRLEKTKRRSTVSVQRPILADYAIKPKRSLTGSVDVRRGKEGEWINSENNLCSLSPTGTLVDAQSPSKDGRRRTMSTLHLALSDYQQPRPSETRRYYSVVYETVPAAGVPKLPELSSPNLAQLQQQHGRAHASPNPPSPH